MEGSGGLVDNMLVDSLAGGDADFGQQNQYGASRVVNSGGMEVDRDEVMFTQSLTCKKKINNSK